MILVVLKMNILVIVDQISVEVFFFPSTLEALASVSCKVLDSNEFSAIFI